MLENLDSIRRWCAYFYFIPTPQCNGQVKEEQYLHLPVLSYEGQYISLSRPEE